MSTHYSNFDPFGAVSEIDTRTGKVRYYSLAALERAGLTRLDRLPFSIRILLESLLRNVDGFQVTEQDVTQLAAWRADAPEEVEIPFKPGRVILQDFTGVPSVVDLAALRGVMQRLGGDPKKINPQVRCDLVIDHSVQTDAFASPQALEINKAKEFERNTERYALLKWAQQAFDNFRVVPPATGIIHQVNLEHLAQVVWTAEEGNRRVAFPDTLVGTDSHTTMINGLAVLGWGVGGIEAEAAMLGQPVSMVIPEVIGFRLIGRLAEGATATDLVLTVTEMLRRKGVVGKLVEFYGPGLAGLPLADRATIGNMAPEYGATCGIFPIDRVTLDYLRLTGRDEARIALVEAYAKEQRLWAEPGGPEPVFTDTLELDLSTVEPSLAGPKRPQDRVSLSRAKASFEEVLPQLAGEGADLDKRVKVEGADYDLGHGDVVIAAITSCTNTSNPGVMLAAGLVAKKARERGLEVEPYVKTSLAPGSRVVTDYLNNTGLMEPLEATGFRLVGYGCTTCIGNSGPLEEPIAAAVTDNNLVAAAVLSGNRNFEGRIHPLVKANYLASPPLVVAYAFAGSLRKDLINEPLGIGKDGQPVYMKDVWPTPEEIHAAVQKGVSPQGFREAYADVFKGDEHWQAMAAGASGRTYDWDADSTYVKSPPYFDGMGPEPLPVRDIEGARILALLGDSITTDHISPAGSIAKDSPAGTYLIEHGVQQKDFNSYGSRRGNHEVMMRGTFANVRLRNEMAPGTEGGWTRLMPEGEQATIYDAAMAYRERGEPSVVIGGKEYGSGSSRDWAAKGPSLLGVRAVIAESFERIHRSNLVGMGILPLTFQDGASRKSLSLDGGETLDIGGLEDGIKPRMDVACTIHREDGSEEKLTLTCRIDTLDEVEYYRHGGILHYVLRQLLAEAGGTAH
jgi:aconitate hydratase